MLLMEENGLKETWYQLMEVLIRKIREDHNPVEDVDVPLDPAALASAVGNCICTCSCSVV